MDLQFSELKKNELTEQTVTDLNLLLPQLSAEAMPITLTWLERIFDSGTRIFIAKDGSRIIGTTLLCSMVILVGQKDWIEDVVVDKAYQGQGIASRLMDMAETASKQGHAKNINLTSNPQRADARNMYLRRGYKLRDTGVFRRSF